MDNMTEGHVFATLAINGKDVPFITDAVVVSWIIMAFLIAGACITTRKLALRPGRAQNTVEALVELVYGICKNTIGHHWKPFAPYMGTVLLFLVCSNIVSIFNIVPSGAFLADRLGIEAARHFELVVAPPTKNFNVTLCLTVMSITIAFFCEFWYKGLRGWLRSFYRPMAINGFVKLLDYAVRPTSLCLRLFGNVLGGFIVMELLYMAFPAVLPAFVSIYFDLFDGALQAYVFVFLTMIYIQEASESV